MSGTEQKKFIDECFAYDSELRRKGHIVGGEALQPAKTAMALRYKNGAVSVTDGPFAETKEQLGGIMLLEASDLNQAIQLLSEHPSVRLGEGTWEIRPSDEEFNAEYETRDRRSSTKAKKQP